MAVLTLTITDAGRQALVDADNTGTGPVRLTEIALGSGLYTPDPAQTALQAEIKRLATFGAEVVAADTLHVTVTDESADTYTLGEFGLYTDGGVLFAVFSQPDTPILEKAAGALALLSVDVVLTSAEPGSVTIGDTDFILPPATETREGLVELADSAEARAGTDTTRAMSPARVHEAFKQFGLGIPGGSAPPRITNPDDTNLPSGLYDCGPHPSNPNDTNGFIYLVQKYGTGEILQTAWSSFGGTYGMWQRWHFSGTWKPWKAFWHTGNFDPATKADASALSAHAGRTDNPHNVTASQVGADPAGTAASMVEAHENAANPHPQYVRTSDMATETVAGLIEIATAAEAQGWNDNQRALTPAKLAAALQGSNQSLGTNGFQKLPGGLILQWGRVPVSLNSTDVSVTYPIAFPTQTLWAIGGLSYTPALTGTASAILKSFGPTGAVFFVDHSDATGTGTLYWLALGN